MINRSWRRFLSRKRFEVDFDVGLKRKASEDFNVGLKRKASECMPLTTGKMKFYASLTSE